MKDQDKQYKNKVTSEARSKIAVIGAMILIVAFLLNFWFVFFSFACGLGDGLNSGNCSLLQVIVPSVIRVTIAGFILTIIFVLSKDWVIKKVFLILSILCQSYFLLAMYVAQVVLPATHLNIELNYKFYINIILGILILVGVLLYVILSLLFN